MTEPPLVPDGTRPSRASRIHGALATVAAMGAVGGFVLGSLILGVLQHQPSRGWAWVEIPFSMMFGGTFGAIVGGIGAPLAGWFLFRHVPLGRAMAVTGAGTLLGASVGWFSVRGPMVGGCAGFLVAAIVLRLARSQASRGG
jgi:NhaP-type Na+/H+ or K+/H+ antiporter